MRFEENRGQFDPRVHYLARQGGLTLFATDEGATLSLRKRGAPPAVLTMKVHDAAKTQRLEHGHALATRSNYFIGNEPARWRTDVPNFADVIYRGVRPGVDLVYHGSREGRLEYDFIVAPGASSDVTLDIEGATNVRVAADGWLEVKLGKETLRQPPPTIYQTINGRQRKIAGRYRVNGRSEIAFLVAEYDHSRALVIDPVIVYSTYLSGTGDDYAQSIAADATGAYVAGTTSSTDFPVANALQNTMTGKTNAFIAKLTPSGNALLYATYVGGSQYDAANAVAVDPAGSAYLAGHTDSANFPVTSGALRTKLVLGQNAFVTKLSSSGNSLVYSTYLGGDEGSDDATGIAVDPSGAAYVVGSTGSPDFPVVHSLKPPPSAAFGSTDFDAFAVKLAPAGDKLVYSTYLGGSDGDSASAVAVDSAGQAHIVGYTMSKDFPLVQPLQSPFVSQGNGFVIKLAADASALIYSTYLGGSRGATTAAVAVDASGAAYVTGATSSSDFPAVNIKGPNGPGTNFQGWGYVAAFAPTGGARLTYSRYIIWPDAGNLGSYSGLGNAPGIAIDPDGEPVVAGNYFGGTEMGMVVKVDPASDTFVYTRMLGTNGGDFGITVARSVALDRNGGVYMTGVTHSADFDVVNALQPKSHKPAGTTGGDPFVAKLDTSLRIVPSVASVAPRASQVFVADGGSGEYTWTLSPNGSGGSIDNNGNYTAGPKGNANDVVTVQDRAGHSASASVSVTAELSVSPANPTTPPRGMIQFTASGGSGGGLGWKLTAPSGGSVDAFGLYTAGAQGNSSDTLQVTDSLGNVAIVNISVGALAISPAAPSVPPRGSVTFSAAGGQAPYWFQLSPNSSGGTLDRTSGVYVAGSTGSVKDVVQVTDALGNTASATVTVGAPVKISPRECLLVIRQSCRFSVTGGSGKGYRFAITTNSSGGSIDATTGVYQAGTTPNSFDKVTVTDSLANSDTALVVVKDTLQLAPSSPSAPPRGTIQFAASGGLPTGGNQYQYWLATNGSGAFIDSSGLYHAGTVGNRSDRVEVEDSAGNTAFVDVTVTAGISITPTSASTPPRGNVPLTASGGSNKGFAWSVILNRSGATIDPNGVYTAGATGNVGDTVQVKDSLGNTMTASISVGGGIIVTPASASIAPRDQLQLTAVGGSGTYAWSIAPGGSGGSVDGNGGYTAGSTGNMTDTVIATDKLGNQANATITVGAGLTITPAGASVAPHGTLSFGVAGGSGSGYRWSLAGNGSGGSIDATSGAYVAGGNANSSDVVQVIDSLGNVTSAKVAIGASVSLSPASTTISPRGTQQFFAGGGSGSYTFSFAANGSGATLSSTSGLYVAGATANANDVVRVVDTLGNAATAKITIGPGVTIMPAAPSVAPRGRVSLGASGGSGTGYAWRLTSNASGAIVDAGGGYQAGDTPDGSDVVEVKDSLGNTASVSITVGDALAINPASPSVAPRGPLTFAATGGGGANHWQISANASGAMIDDAGHYTAGATGNVTDIVSVTDANGGTATVRVAVGAGVSVSPAVSTVKAGGRVMFAVSGGSGSGYQWSLAGNGSGAMLDTSGAYVAGTVVGSDQVHVVDSLGNSADATVTVTASQPGPGSGTPPDLGTLPSGEPDPATGTMPTRPASGCGCEVGGAGGDDAPTWLLALLLLALGARRLARTNRGY
jgi:hypothetical protein